MLESLRVRNVALIDEAEVEFKPGLNILTGETGAGKSVLIGSINLALGSKADKNMIRTGEEFAFVELVFSVYDKIQVTRLKEMDIYPEDGQLILQRRILPTRSVCKVNGETITNKMLREIGEILLDIHSQHEHQSLIKESKQFELLDSFCGSDLVALKEKLKMLLSDYKDKKKELASLADSNSDKEKELAFALFEFTEITEASLIEGEDVKLEQTYHKMSNARKLTEGVSRAYEFVNGANSETTASLFSTAVGEISSLVRFDEDMNPLYEDMLNAEDVILQIGHKLEEYLRNFSFDEREYLQVTERLNLINHLKSKYGNTIPEILSYARDKEKQIEKLTNIDKYKEHLKISFSKVEKEVLKICNKMSRLRETQAGLLSDEMEHTLRELHFPDVRFKIEMNKNDEPNADGLDKVSFLISLNPGEPLKPLSTVASGGELSRVMLALKTVFADKDHIETLIFDEIDAGISGRTAWKVSEKLGILGRKHQVICITHLPQIASMADTHFVIEKSNSNKKAVTTIKPLDENETYNELARILGSDEITAMALENAKELKITANNVKNNSKNGRLDKEC